MILLRFIAFLEILCRAFPSFLAFRYPSVMLSPLNIDPHISTPLFCPIFPFQGLDYTLPRAPSFSLFLAEPRPIFSRKLSITAFGLHELIY